MWLWNSLACVLIIFLRTSAQAHQEGKGSGDKENGPVLIEVPIGTADQSDNGTLSTNSSSVPDAIALKLGLNCTNIEIKHIGTKINIELTYGMIPRPTSSNSSLVNTTENPKDLKHRVEAETESEYDEDITANRENEATEKTMKHEELKSKRSTGDVNPSKNVTVHDNYSNVKTYTAAEPATTKTPEPTEMPVTKICTAPFDDDGEQFNWYQILVENGGVPGDVNSTRLIPNITHVLNPCERPIMDTVPPFEDLLYKYEMIEFEKVYRKEEAFLRFPGTDSEFIDIHGHFAWSPPGHYKRFYVLEYRKDDTGFYIKVHQGQKCEFSSNPVMIKCAKPRKTCTCTQGVESCDDDWRFSHLSPLPSLIGG